MRHREHKIDFALIFRCAENFMFPTCKNSEKRIENQKSTDKYWSFDDLIQEDVDLPDIYIYLSVCLQSQIKLILCYL